MTATLSQGASISFDGTTYLATSISVRGGSKEVIDMTGKNAGLPVLIHTDSYTSPPTVEVEALTLISPVDMVGSYGPLDVSIGLTGNAICTDASIEAKVGDLLRVRMTFVLTNHTG